MPEPEDTGRTSPIAFLGSRGAALAFRAMGFDVYGAEDARHGTRLWEKIAKAGYSAIFVSETLAAEMKAILEPYYLRPLPAVILVPERQPGIGLAAERIRLATLKAVGAEI